MHCNTLLKTSGLLSLLCVSITAQAAWEERLFNPHPLEDDVILPMPCEGSMVFRRVPIAQHSVLDDKQIILGQDNKDWGYVEQSRPSYISGSFDSDAGPEKYYLIAKYELTELQYQAMMGESCPKASMQLRLPAASYSWMDAVQFSDKYNLWLQQNAKEQIPLTDGEPGFIRLPTEDEWEFAARGGIAVDEGQFRASTYPMPEGLVSYEWFAGSQSSNGKPQLVGLLKPNPLGIHDMLGNVSEMMFEPFRLNKLNRLHGQAGGMVVRGGNYLSSQAEIRSAARKELPYYQNHQPNQPKTTGMRFVLVSSALPTRDRVNQISAEWQSLGAGTAHEGNAEAVQQLQVISSEVEDQQLKDQLTALESELRASNERTTQARNEAILSSLNLGSFLCTKLNDDGKYLNDLKKNYDTLCAEGDEIDSHCPARLAKIEDQQERVQGVLNYYRDNLVKSARIYNKPMMEQQFPIMNQIIKNDSKIRELGPYLQTHWAHQFQYFDSKIDNQTQWLNDCVAITQ